MKRWSLTLSLTALGIGMLAAQDPPLSKPAAKPAQTPSKPAPPPPPAVNAGNAKLEITIAGLDGPGWAIAAGNDTIAAGCEQGSILVWNKDAIEAARKGAVKPQVLKAHQGPVVALAWNGGPVLASAGADKKLILWKMPEGKPLHTLPLATLPRALAMSGDGKLLASAGEDVVVQLWDVAAAKPTVTLKDHGDWVTCLDWSGDGKQLASGDLAGRVLVWDVAGGKKIAELPGKPMPPPKTPPEPVAARALCFAADGKGVLVGDANGLIQHHNLADGKVLRGFTGHTGPVTGLALHPGGAVLISSSKDRTVKVWNATAPQPASQAVKNLEGHTAWIEGLALLAQFTQVASVSADQTVRIWDFAEPKKK